VRETASEWVTEVVVVDAGRERVAVVEERREVDVVVVGVASTER